MTTVLEYIIIALLFGILIAAISFVEVHFREKDKQDD